MNRLHMKTLLPPRDLLIFLRQWKPQVKQPLLGLDCGRVNLGLAVSDEDYTVAIPLRNLRVAELSIPQKRSLLLEVCERYGIGGLVVGWPLLPNGEPSKQCSAVYSFVKEIDLQLPTTLWDERYSSQVAETIRNYARHSRQGRNRPARATAQKEVTDYLAAAQILQEYLNFANRREA